MSILREEKNYELLNTCNKCGFCVQGCSVYKEHLNEAFGTRGRIRLIKAVADGELERTPLYEKIINSCLMCEECSKNCPSGVPGHLLVQLAREDLAKIKGLPFTKKFPVEKVLPNNSLRKLSFKSFRIGKGVIPQTVKGINIKSLNIDKEDFLTGFKPVKPPENPKFKVGFFVGCMMNHTMAEAAHALVRVLTKEGCEVIVPKDQRCCGTPAFVYGRSEVTKSAALNNVKAFKGVDVIVTGCASCGNMLKSYATKLFPEHNQDQKLVTNFSNKVKDITQFLVDDLNISLDKMQSTIKGKVTYHDPCHLVRGQNISAQPRKILQELQGIEYVEMPGASKCCGASGMFQYFYPEEATSISRKKVENIKKTNADYLVTNCPACYQRIKGSLEQNNMPQKVMHIIELLDSK
ncbi:MAG: (Fe-S)-binding protein [Peptococcales bacterium]|jgi:glycolate oxidase iron-sulfur subunit